MKWAVFQVLRGVASLPPVAPWVMKFQTVPVCLGPGFGHEMLETHPDVPDASLRLKRRDVSTAIVRPRSTMLMQVVLLGCASFSDLLHSQDSSKVVKRRINQNLILCTAFHNWARKE